jgi:three-Cys-motif partner protein
MLYKYTCTDQAREYAMPKKVTANTVKPHTEAKLQFYSQYLERYLAILLRAKGVDQINIYDLYSGAGVYSDGKKGSAVRAVDIVWEQMGSAGQSLPINLLLNDLDVARAQQLEQRLSSRQSAQRGFTIAFRNLEAAELLTKLPNKIKTQTRTTRNLIFVDPYGYKDIDPMIFKQIMAQGRSEIILFLPIEDMYRFLNVTVDSEVDKAFQPLKHFIEKLGIQAAEVQSETDFILAISEALKFSTNFYTAAYSIVNHHGRLYAMFFMTANLRGLEKIIEVKWKLDAEKGEGFTGSDQEDFFLKIEKMALLKHKLQHYLVVERSNVEIFEYIICLGFRATHAVQCCREWQKSDKLQVTVAATGMPAKKSAFYIKYAAHKDESKRLMFKYTGENHE